jgi:arylsulfatase A-like enzyme
LRDNTIIVFASNNGGGTSSLFAQGAKSKEER